MEREMGSVAEPQMLRRANFLIQTKWMALNNRSALGEVFAMTIPRNGCGGR
jgi:hypothetical protein